MSFIAKNKSSTGQIDFVNGKPLQGKYFALFTYMGIFNDLIFCSYDFRKILKIQIAISFETDCTNWNWNLAIS